MFLLFFGASKKTKPIGGHKGCVFCFCGAFKKTIRRAQGLRFCFFGAVRKNKSNRRAQGLYFWFLWASKKNKSNTRAEIEGNVCLRETNRAHAGGSHPVPPSGSSGSGAYFIH